MYRSGSDTRFYDKCSAVTALCVYLRPRFSLHRTENDNITLRPLKCRYHSDMEFSVYKNAGYQYFRFSTKRDIPVAFPRSQSSHEPFARCWWTSRRRCGTWASRTPCVLETNINISSGWVAHGALKVPCEGERKGRRPERFSVPGATIGPWWVATSIRRGHQSKEASSIVASRALMPMVLLLHAVPNEKGWGCGWA